MCSSVFTHCISVRHIAKMQCVNMKNISCPYDLCQKSTDPAQFFPYHVSFYRTTSRQFVQALRGAGISLSVFSQEANPTSYLVTIQVCIYIQAFRAYIVECIFSTSFLFRGIYSCEMNNFYLCSVCHITGFVHCSKEWPKKEDPTPRARH